MLDKIEQIFVAIILALSITALVVAAYGDESRRRNNARMDPNRGVLTQVADAGTGDGGDATTDASIDSGLADVGVSDGGVANDAGYACYEVYNFLAWDTELQFVPACTEFSWLPGWIYVTNSGAESEAIYCTGCTAQAGPDYYSLLTGCTRGATAIACGPGQYGCRMADPANSEGYLSVEALGFSPVGN